jgi:hypothetical protein
MTSKLSPVSFGLCRPLYATQRTPGRLTLGPRVADVAETLGKPAMPWQRYVYDVALEIDEDKVDRQGRPLPAYHTIIIVVMRQNGKTELIFPAMTHRVMAFDDFGPQRILYTAQTADDARKKWRDVHVARLLKSPYKSLFTPRLALNKEALLWVNGSSWSPASTTAKTGGTGDTLDMGVIDEAWAADRRREAAMRPAMLTRPARQTWIMSMVPGPSRASTAEAQFLRDKIALGREAVRNDVRSGIFYIEFGAEEGMDPLDPATWWSCMPALGHTIGESSIQDDLEVMDMLDFEAEYLSWWAQEKRAMWMAVPQLAWQRASDPESGIANRISLSIDAEEARDKAVIASAGLRADGNWHIEVVEPGQDIPAGTVGMGWVIDRACDIYEKNDALTITIDPRGPAQSFILPLRNRGVHVTTPNSLETAAACGALVDAIKEGRTGEPDGDKEPGKRAYHIGQPELARSLSTAEKVTSDRNRTFTWKRGEGSGEVWAVTLAMHGYEKRMTEDYDVRDSVAAADGECPGCGAYPSWDGGPTEHYDDCDREAAQ